MKIDPNNPKIQLILASIFGSYISIGLGYMLAWGWIPKVTDVNSVAGFIAAAIASVLAPVAIALINLFFFRVNKLVEYLGKLAEDPESDVAGVVMKHEGAAEQIPSEKVVARSEAQNL